MTTINFRKLDTNNDGRLDSKEISNARKMGVTKELWISMTEDDFYGEGSYKQTLETAKKYIKDYEPSFFNTDRKDDDILNKYMTLMDYNYEHPYESGFNKLKNRVCQNLTRGGKS